MYNKDTVSKDSKFTKEGLELIKTRGFTVVDRSTVMALDLYDFLLAEDAGWRLTDYLRTQKIKTKPELLSVETKLDFVELYMGTLPESNLDSTLLDYIRASTLSPYVPGFNYAADKFYIVYRPLDILV